MIEDWKSFPFVGGGRRGQTGYEPALRSNRETLLQDHSTAAGGGITAEVTQKSRGNFVLTSQGTFHRFSSHDSTAKKGPRAAEELARRKLNITPAGKGNRRPAAPERRSGRGCWNEAFRGWERHMGGPEGKVLELDWEEGSAEVWLSQCGIIIIIIKEIFLLLLLLSCYYAFLLLYICLVLVYVR